jgi:hypothetical protein
MSAHSNLGEAPRTPTSTDPGVRKIVEDILRGWATDPTLAFLDAIPIHPTARVIARDTLRRWTADQRISVSRKVSREMQGELSQTRHIELELSGELPSYLEGSTRRILVSAVYQRLIRLAIQAHPLDSPEKKARQPAHMRRVKPRPAPVQERDRSDAGNHRHEHVKYKERRTHRKPLPIDEIAAALRRLFPSGRSSRDTHDVMLDRLKKDGVVTSLSTLKRAFKRVGPDWR